jgi:hypothetical protein
VSELPSLTFLGALLAITISLVCSFFLRSDARIHVIRFFDLLNAAAETIIALQYQNHSWMLAAYYIEVSASTAIGIGGAAHWQRRDRALSVQEAARHSLTHLIARGLADYFFSATRIQTPDYRSCSSPGRGVALNVITPRFLVARRSSQAAHMGGLSPQSALSTYIYQHLCSSG